jgi:hypothetical protein
MLHPKVAAMVRFRQGGLMTLPQASLITMPKNKSIVHAGEWDVDRSVCKKICTQNVVVGGGYMVALAREPFDCWPL